MNQTRIELRYGRGDATADDVQAVVDELLPEVTNLASKAASQARTGGLDPAEGLPWIADNTMGSVLLRHHPDLKSALRATTNAFQPWSLAAGPRNHTPRPRTAALDGNGPATGGSPRRDGGM